MSVDKNIISFSTRSLNTKGLYLMAALSSANGQFYTITTRVEVGEGTYSDIVKNLAKARNKAMFIRFKFKGYG
jgi:hypothetical protein